jgi:hypothetical protein
LCGWLQSLEQRFVDPQKSSWRQKNRYEVQRRFLRSLVAADAQERADWDQVSIDREDDLTIEALLPGAAYALRVRSVNAKGRSDWVETTAWTKQVPNEHDGGIGEIPGGTYTWRQTKAEVEVRIPMEQATKAVELKTKEQWIDLTIEGKPVFSGKLGGKCKGNESFWQFETEGGKRMLLIQMVKATMMEKWAFAVEGSCPIDTAKMRYWMEELF